MYVEEELTVEQIAPAIKNCIEREGLCPGCEYCDDGLQGSCCKILHSCESLFTAFDNLREELDRTKKRLKREHDELKPCPFCGGHATGCKYHEYGLGDRYWIECDECGARTVDNWKSFRDAIKKWNRRVNKND